MASAANAGAGGPAGSSEAIPVAGMNKYGASGVGGAGGVGGVGGVVGNLGNGRPEPPFWNVAKSPVDEARMSLGARPGGGVASAGHQRDMSLSASASRVLDDCRKELSNLRQVRVS